MSIKHILFDKVVFIPKDFFQLFLNNCKINSYMPKIIVLFLVNRNILKVILKGTSL